MQASAAQNEQYALAKSGKDGLNLGGGRGLLGAGRNTMRLGTGDAGDGLVAAASGEDAYLDRAAELRAQQGPIMTDAGPQNLYGGAQAGDNLAFEKGNFVLPGEAAQRAFAKRAAEQSVNEAPKLIPWIEGAAPVLGKMFSGLGLFFHMDDAPTTDWSAAGSKFSYNQDDFTLRVTDGESGKSLAVPGIQKPDNYTDAQYLSYVSYKANGGQLAIDDFVSFDPPSMGPVDRASSNKPEWLQRLDAGNAFNKERLDAKAYPYNEVYIYKPSGEGYFRVDSYNPEMREIVSRKFTQFSEITERTGIDYVNEMTAKYPDGARIANVPTNIKNGLAGQLLTGNHVLEVPVQFNPIPQAVIDAANRASVLIRDIKGKIY